MNLTFKHTKAAAYIGYITQAIVNNLMPLLFVSFQHIFALSLDKISLLITLNFGTQMMIDIIGARYIDKIGYRTALVAAHVAAVTGLCGLSVLPFAIPPLVGLGVCTVLCAIGGGLTEVVISPTVEALPGDGKTSAMSLLHSFYCWGQAGVILLSTLFFMLFGVENWRILPLILMLVPLFNVFLCSAVPLRTLADSEDKIPMGRLFKEKTFWLFTMLMLCAGASELVMSQWASLFAETGLNVSKTVGDLLGPCAFALLMGFARLFFGIRGEKTDLKRLLLYSSLLCCAGYLTAVFAPKNILSLLGCAVCGLSVGIMWPGTLSMASKHYSGGTAMFAVLALSGDIGCTAGPTLCGLIADGTGSLKEGMLVSVIFPALLAVSVVLLIHKRSAKENPIR